jgi:hypothetical protein
MTLTTTVMVMETTGAMQLIVPLMITVFVAKVGPFGIPCSDPCSTHRNSHREIQRMTYMRWTKRGHLLIKQWIAPLLWRGT